MSSENGVPDRPTCKEGEKYCPNCSGFGQVIDYHYDADLNDTVWGPFECEDCRGSGKVRI